MYVIIGSHSCKDNIKCDSVSNVPKCLLNNGVSIVQKLFVKLSNTSTNLDNIFATGGSNIVEVFESLTTSIWTMDTLLFSGHLGEFDAPSH